MLIPGGLESAVLAAVILLFFLVIGAREASSTQDGDQFYFAGGDATPEQIARGWAAATISFAVALFYYIQMTYLFGLWIFLVSLGTYLAGNLIFARAMEKCPPSQFRSVGFLVFQATGSKVLAVAIDYASLISLLAILYIELSLGAQLASGLFLTSEVAAEIILFLTLVLVVGGYVWLGGMRAVLASDRWQLTVVRIGISAFVLIAFGAAWFSISQGTWSLNLQPAVPFFAKELNKDDIFSYLIFGLAVNTLTIFTQTSSWQLATSSDDANRAKGIFKGIFHAFLIFTIIVIIGFIFRSSQLPMKDSGDLFEPASALGTLGTHFLVPLAFAGFIAALVSTADTILLSSTLTLNRLISGAALQEFDQSQGSVSKEPRSPESSWADVEPVQDARAPSIGRAPSGPAALRYVSLLLIGAGIVGTYLVVKLVLGTSIERYFLYAILYLFSHGAVFAPIILASLLSPERVRSSRLVVGGLFALWLGQTVAAAIAIASEQLKIQFFATVIAVVISYVISVKPKS